MSDIRDKLLGSVQRRYSTVEVPGLGAVRLQSLTELERAQIEQVAATDVTRMRAQLIAVALVDDAGNRLFSDQETDHILRMDSRLTGELSTAVMLHVGRQDTTEDQVKNSEGTPAEPAP